MLSALIVGACVGLASSWQVSGASPRFFVKSDGSVLASGGNSPDMLPGYEWRTVPAVNFARLSLPGPVRQIDATTSQVLALMTDGTVLAWGSSAHSILGPGVGRTSQPTPLAGLEDIVQVGIGWNHAAALRSDGKVLTWGQHTYGVLGDGKDDDKEDGSPKVVSGLTDVTAISVGGRSTLVLRKDGTVWAWGCNSVGQLGQGTTGRCIATPVQVKGLQKVRQISADKNDNGANAAITSDGKVWVWGGNSSSMLGNGKRDGFASVPVAVKGVTGAKQVAVGLGFIVVVHTDGTVTNWGFNGFGGLGIGKTGGYNMSPQKPKVSGIASAFPSGYATFLVKTNGALLWSGSGDGSKTGPMSKKVSKFTALTIP